jgi:hypothetical protein
MVRLVWRSIESTQRFAICIPTEDRGNEKKISSLSLKLSERLGFGAFACDALPFA